MTNPVTADDRRARPDRNRRILAMLAPHLWPRGETELCARVVVAVAFLVIAKIVTVYVPIFYRDLVDTVAGRHGALVVPVGLLLAYGGARALAAAFGELRDAVFAKVAQRAIRTIALRVFRHLHELGLRFHLERRTGGLSRNLERGGKAIQFMLRILLFNIVPTVFEVLLVAAILWRLYDWRFAAVTMAVIAAYVAYTFVVTDWRVQYMRAMNRIDTEANTRAVDSLLNYETVKYFGNEAHEARRYDESLSGYERAAVMSTTSLSLLNLGQGTIIAIGLTITMTMAAHGVVAGTMSIGDLVLVNAYLLQLYMPLNFLGVVYREIKQSLTDMEAMFDLLEVRREVDDPPGAPALSAARGEIAFENVSFGYDADRGILHDVSFRVPAGQTVAVVGPSGAGKSTLSRLIYRFYDVQAGAIRIDGQDIRAVSQASLRAAIGMVPQDTVLFNDTLRYNIAYGRTDASDADIEAAARLVRIHDFIATLPQGYATVVGERGLKLSGGERQRVAIARMILKRPRIMLFDEATSALDSATEREIQRSLDEVSRDRTTLIVAHRLSTVVHADEILVLEAGRIVERGGHEALLAAGGTYATMWARQQEVANLERSLEVTMAALRQAQAAD